MTFDNNVYAESARREGGEQTKECLEWLSEQGQLGEEYMEEAIHQMGGDYFERFFDDVEEMQEDFELFTEGTQEVERQ